MKACFVATLIGVAVLAQPTPAVQNGRIEVPGGSLAYDAAGAGPAVVFLHGAFMDRKSWDHQFPVFARRFRVIRCDIRPFGESTRPDKPYVVPDDLLAVLDHVKIPRAHPSTRSRSSRDSIAASQGTCATPPPDSPPALSKSIGRGSPTPTTNSA
jgi:hypothetical protein